MKKYLRYLGPVLITALFVLAIYLLYHKLKAYSIAQIRESIQQVSTGSICFSIGLMIVNYIILVGYDWLALKAIHKSLPLPRVGLVSLVGQAVSYNFGALLGGTSVRYRFYSAWGFSLVEIVRLVLMLAVTFWIGALGLAGGVLLFARWAEETFGWGPETVIANQAPLYFDVSVMDVYGAMRCGGKLILTPEVLFRFPVKLPEFLRENGVTSIYWVPTVMINIANSGVLDSVELPELRSVAFAGEVMPNLQLNIWRRALPGRMLLRECPHRRLELREIGGALRVHRLRDTPELLAPRDNIPVV